MTTSQSDDERVMKAAAFLKAEYGERAIDEAEKGLLFAERVGNKDTMEAFTAILRCLKTAG